MKQMCQTAVISDKIVRLSTRSLRQRREAVGGHTYTIAKLSRLNSSLDDFYEFLYNQLDDVTCQDYNIFGPQLSILISTIKDLYTTCLSLPMSWGFSTETDKLGKNYSALYEIAGDLRRYGKGCMPDEEMQNLLAQAGISLKNLTH